MVASARVARLAFADDDEHPRVLPVTFALAEGSVWSAIDRKPKRTAEPARVGYLRRNPSATLLMDHYSDDWEKLAWVQLLGRVQVLDGDDAAAGLAALAVKYEPYRSETPPGPILRLDVDRTVHWRALK